MLRIEKHSDGCVSKLRLSGRIQSDHIDCIRSALNDGCPRKMLDLGEVTLVDIAAVRFLIRCEDEGIELVECPPYVREWMLRERTEGSSLALRMPPDSIGQTARPSQSAVRPCQAV